MITLGVETSCDETSVAIVSGRKILSNVVASSLEEQKRYGGVVPEIASRAQLEVLLPTLDEALKKAKVPLRKVDLIAVTRGPGLMGSILVGLSAAKALSLALGKPLVGVDHVLAHAYAGFLSDPKLKFPCLGLVVSGGHTMLLRMESASHMKTLGKTLDDAAGEAFDKVAKILGLGYPGGPEIDRLSKKQDPNVFRFTRPFLSSDSLDFSFSGIKTAVYHQVEALKKKAKGPGPKVRAQICSGFQEAVCETLVKKSVRAAARENLKTIVIGGGVSANSRLREMMAEAADEAGLKAVFPPLALCQDNAAMIASYGEALYREGRRDALDMPGYPDFEHHDGATSGRK